MNRTVRELLKDQSRPALLATDTESPVSESVAAMNDAGVGSVLVLSHDDRLLGIFTERDALTRVIETGRDPAETTIGSVMTPMPVCIGPDVTVRQAKDAMRVHQVCHLPVVDDEQVIGVIALRDIVSTLADDLGSENRELSRYIHGPMTRAPESFLGAASLPPESGVHGF